MTDWTKDYLEVRKIGVLDNVSFLAARHMPATDIRSIHEQVIEKGFYDVNAATGSHQHMTLDEFENDVHSTDVIKFFAECDYSVVAVMTVHIGLERVVWIDHQPILALQAAHDKKAQPLYIGTIVIDPTFVGVDRIGTELMKAAFTDYVSRSSQHPDSLIFFDCVWKNVPFIPSIVQQAISTESSRTVLSFTAEDNHLRIDKFNPQMPQPKEGHFNFVIGPSELTTKSVTILR